MVRKTKIAYYLIALILACLFIFSLSYISFGKEIIFFFLPLPFIILAALAPYLSIALNILFGLGLYEFWGKTSTLGFILGVALFSWVIGYLMHFSCQVSKIILVGIVLASIGTGVFFLTAGENGLSQYRENFDKALADSVSHYRERGVEEEKLASIQETMMRIARIVISGFPAIVFISLAAMVSSNYFLASRVLAKAGYYTLPISSLSNLKIPDPFIWVFIGAGFTIWAGRAFGLELVYKVGLNFMILMLAAYLGQGLILVNFFLKKWKWPVILRMFLYLLLIVQPVFLILIVLWGVFEVWFNFRKIQVQ